MTSGGETGAGGAGGTFGVAGAESGGTPGSSGMSSSGGTSSTGGTKGSAGMPGSAGKGGSATGGGGAASMGGSPSSGGKGGSTGSAGMTGSAGKTGTTTPCDAAHAVATLSHADTFTGKANDCVRLSVNPDYAAIKLDLDPQEGTAKFPVPFSFTGCAGNGTGKLTAVHGDVIFKTGSNPGCDYYVQFTGDSSALEFVYYD